MAAYPAFLAAVALLALAGVATATVSFTNDVYAIHAGEPFTLHWTGASGPVTITLMNGPDSDLQPVFVLASYYSGSSYTWTPPSTLASDGYELEINDGSSADYSPRFQFPGSGSGSGTPTSVASTSQPTASNPTATASNPTSTSGSGSSNASSTASSPLQTQSNGGEGGSDSGSGTGLSTGAKVGIGVGAGAGGLLVLCLLICLIYKRRKAAGRRPEAFPAGAIDSDKKADRAGLQEPPKAEMGGGPWDEIGSSWNRAELAPVSYDRYGGYQMGPVELSSEHHRREYGA